MWAGDRETGMRWMDRSRELVSETRNVVVRTL